MKGLIFKEFYISRKKLIYALGFFLVFSMFGILFFVSLDCGNIAKLNESMIAKGEQGFTGEMLNTVYSTFTYAVFAIGVFSVFALSSYESDYKVKWDIYEFASPASEQKIVASFIAHLIALGIAIALGFINAVIISAVSGIPMTMGTVKKLALIAVIAILLISGYIPLSYKYKTANKIAARVIPVLAIAYVGLMGFIFWRANDNPDILENFMQKYLPEFISKAADIIFPFSPIIIIAGIALGYFASVMALKRREN